MGHPAAGVIAVDAQEDAPVATGAELVPEVDGKALMHALIEVLGDEGLQGTRRGPPGTPGGAPADHATIGRRLRVFV